MDALVTLKCSPRELAIIVKALKTRADLLRDHGKTERHAVSAQEAEIRLLIERLLALLIERLLA